VFLFADGIKALTYSRGSGFSTRDRDNDQWTSGSCARDYWSAWWYKSCSKGDLNGVYKVYRDGKFKGHGTGIEWMPLKGSDYSLKFTEMKLRPHDIPQYV